MTVSRPIVIGLLAVVALACFGLSWVYLDLGREGDMREAESDFLTRLRNGELRGGPTPAPKPSPSAAGNEAELASWYASDDDRQAAPTQETATAEQHGGWGSD